MPDSKPFFSILIPAYNEEGIIATTVRTILSRFSAEGISDFEILVVNDNSKDGTESVLQGLASEFSSVRYVNNTPPNGIGFAVRKGLDCFRGDAVAVVMADLSDSPDDIVTYYRKFKDGAECVFGSRFIKGGKVINYPRAKFLPNRMANAFIKTLFHLKHNDITNAFKGYRREVIDGIRPILSHHFNITVELPLKAIVRGYKFETVPISWTGRTVGKSNLKLKEMGSRYLFIVLYCLLEKKLSKGDYKRKQPGL